MSAEHTFTRTLVISSTAADGLSGVVQVSGGLPVGLIVSAAWTAADITFQASPIGSAAFSNLAAFDGTVVQSTAVVAGQWQNLDASVFAGIDRLKVRSGTVASAVQQGSSRTLTLVLLERADKGRR